LLMLDVRGRLVMLALCMLEAESALLAVAAEPSTETRRETGSALEARDLWTAAAESEGVRWVTPSLITPSWVTLWSHLKDTLRCVPPRVSAREGGGSKGLGPAERMGE
jgi:hypothetical protein